ncbi:SLAP domain-containing protein [Lactobacillus nasalidis]|uniref:SLAP domain-containing protein n=1 Tax=Lactobacillus nasalidis TaxID=2797258 RepID=UPI0027DCB5D2|nr:SLAP domain-containing protein [Lactobacillus nasalidis]
MTINGQTAKTSKAKDGSVTYTFAASAYQTSSKTASLTVNGQKFTADVVFGALPDSAYLTVTETSATAKKLVKKNSAVYNRSGAKTKDKSIKAGKTITTYGVLTRGSVKYYKVSKTASKYIKASNVDGSWITLKNSAAVYTKDLKKTKTSYKKGKKVYAYAYAILGGEKYYKLGTNKYIKALSADGHYITLKHGAVVYSKDLKKTSTSYGEGKKVLTFGSTSLNKRKYYQVGQNKFIVASNVDGTKRTLKKNAYVYKKSKGKAVRYKKYVLKKNSQHKTYGSAVTINGKKYYIIAVGQYAVKSNFR